MDSIRAYLLSVTAAAILCGCVRTIFQKKDFHGKITKLLTGLFILVTVIAPITGFQIKNWSDYIHDIELDSADAAQAGKEDTIYAVQTIIKEQCEEYIEDKAASYGVTVDAQIIFESSESTVPYEISILGEVSPYSKGILSEKITNDLGIPKEHQIWNKRQ